MTEEEKKEMRKHDRKELKKARKKAIKALRKVNASGHRDSLSNLDAICDAVYHSDWGWTAGACEGLRMRLLWLLGGLDG